MYEPGETAILEQGNSQDRGVGASVWQFGLPALMTTVVVRDHHDLPVAPSAADLPDLVSFIAIMGGLDM